MQEVIGSTPIFSTLEKHYQSSSYGLFRSCFFVCLESRCKHGVNKYFHMVRDYASSFWLTYSEFDTLVARFARLAAVKIGEFLPQAPDRKYVEDSLLVCWREQLFNGLDAEVVVEHIESSYRMGTAIHELVGSTMRAIENLQDRRGQRGHTSFNFSVNGSRDAFKYIIHLFAYRRIVHMRTNPYQKEIRLSDTLPATEGTMFDELIKLASTNQVDESSPFERIEWLGSQSKLAALLVTLKKEGWIAGYHPYQIVKRAFSNTNTIEQILRPGGIEGEATFDRISDKDFAAFKGIRANFKKK